MNKRQIRSLKAAQNKLKDSIKIMERIISGNYFEFALERDLSKFHGEPFEEPEGILELQIWAEYLGNISDEIEGLIKDLSE